MQNPTELHPFLSASRFSISNDLKFDAERDLKDIDAPYIPVLALNKVSPRGISGRAGKYVEIFVTVDTHMSKSKSGYQSFEYFFLLF